MNRLIDFYNDPDKVVFKSIQRRYESQGAAIPPFVTKRAMSEGELKGLANAEFACPERRLFPVSSKADTWRSIAYFNVLKSAALSPASGKEREGIRSMLAKAASLWGLDDEEVAELAHDVTLALPKKADADPLEERACRFVAEAGKMPERDRREQADLLLHAAGAEKLDEEVRGKLARHAGAATCTANDARRVLDRIIPDIPYRSDVRKPLVEMRDCLVKTAKSALLSPEDATSLVALVENVAARYHLKTSAAEDLRVFGLDDAERALREATDTVHLPGGIRARKAAIAENIRQIGIELSNRHGIEAHGVDRTIEALQGLTPVGILPLRPLIGG